MGILYRHLLQAPTDAQHDQDGDGVEIQGFAGMGRQCLHISNRAAKWLSAEERFDLSSDNIFFIHIYCRKGNPLLFRHVEVSFLLIDGE